MFYFIRDYTALIMKMACAVKQLLKKMEMFLKVSI